MNIRLEPDAFVTADELAEILRTTRISIYAKASRGQLPGVVRIGRRILFSRDALIHFLDQNRAPSPQRSR
jgi:excisionase family DNA binding protein